MLGAASSGDADVESESTDTPSWCVPLNDVGKGVHVDPIVACEEFYGTQTEYRVRVSGARDVCNVVSGVRVEQRIGRRRRRRCLLLHIRNKLVQKIFNMNLEVHH